MINKTPPYNLEAEQSVIGGVFMRPDIMDELLSKVQSADFYSSVHQTIFEVLSSQFQDNKPIDLVTISNTLKDAGKLEKIGNSTYLTSLTESVISPTTSLSHADIVKEKSIRRQIIEVTQQAQGDAWESQEEIGTILDRTQHIITELSLTAQPSGAERVKDTLKRVFDNLENNQGTYNRIPTGYFQLDKIMGGLFDTNLIILAARPAQGKTALAGNLLSNVVLGGHSATFFSLEMSREQIVQRMLSQISGVPYQLIKDCSLADQQWSELFKAASRLQDSKLFIDDSPRLTIYELRSRARKMKKRSGLDLVVVDYLTKISPAHSKDRTRDQEVTEIAEDLKALAKELKIPVLCLAQLNRKCEERPNKRPRLSDLRESGGIEQAADDILFLYRDEVYNKAEDNPLKNVAEIIVAKQRNGPEGTVKLRFDGPTMNFQNLIPSISSSEVDNGHF